MFNKDLIKIILVITIRIGKKSQDIVTFPIL